MAAVRHLGFVKFEFFKRSGRLRDPFCINIPNLVKIGRSNRCAYIAIFVIFKMAAAAILDLLDNYWDTHGDHFMVSIVVQNLVEIDAVVSMT